MKCCHKSNQLFFKSNCEKTHNIAFSYSLNLYKIAMMRICTDYFDNPWAFSRVNKFSELCWTDPCAVPKSATATNKTLLDINALLMSIAETRGAPWIQQKQCERVSSVQNTTNPYSLRC